MVDFIIIPRQKRTLYFNAHMSDLFSLYPCKAETDEDGILELVV